MAEPRSTTVTLRKPIVPTPFKDTPFHRRLSSRVPQTSTNVYKEPAFVEAAIEMLGKFWGPVPVGAFFKEFLDVKPKPPRLPRVNYNQLVEVASFRTEPEMYDPLVRSFSSLRTRTHPA